FAARVFGLVAHVEGAFSGMGLNLLEASRRYNASQYAGILFSARASASRTTLRVSLVSGRNPGRLLPLQPGKTFELSSEWQTYTLRFAELESPSDSAQARLIEPMLQQL